MPKSINGALCDVYGFVQDVVSEVHKELARSVSAKPAEEELTRSVSAEPTLVEEREIRMMSLDDEWPIDSSWNAIDQNEGKEDTLSSS